MIRLSATQNRIEYGVQNILCHTQDIISGKLNFKRVRGRCLIYSLIREIVDQRPENETGESPENRR